MAVTRLSAGGLLLLATFTGALAEYCYNLESSDGRLDCITGCCGDVFNQHCCFGVGEITGLAFGCIVFVVFIIGIVCCCKRRGASPSTMIFSRPQPAATTVVTSVNSTHMGTVGMAPGTYPYGQGQTNAGYAGYPGQHGVPPPMGAAGYPIPGPQDSAGFELPPAYDTAKLINPKAPN